MKLFGKKDKDAKKSKAKKEKGAKPKQERKTREGGLFGEAGFKGFMEEHCEKLAFGLAVMVAGLLVLMGLMKDPGIAANETPDRLQKEVDAAAAKMQRPTWVNDFQPKRVLDKNFGGDVDKALIPVSVTEYQVANLLSTPLVAPRISRVDPELLPVRDLEVRPGYGALAMNPAAAGARGRLSDADQRAIEDYIQQRTSNRLNQYDPPWQDFLNVAGDARYVGKYFVCVTGLVPYGEQMQLYRDSLASSSIYDAERDKPNYRFWLLQRAEVGQEPLQWKRLTHSNIIPRQSQTWAGQAKEQSMNPIMDYVDASLTGPVPPMLYDRLPEVVWHSKLPRSRREIKDGPESIREKSAPDTADALEFGAAQPGTSNEWNKAERELGPDYKYEEVVPYKLFRYVDTDVQPGKQYVYRVRLMLDDPNNPSPKYTRVSPQDRDQSVEERILEEKMSKNSITQYAHKQYARWTAFSEPSPSVQVSPGREMIAGRVTAPEKATMRDVQGTYVKAGDEPTAQAIALMFDARRAASLAGEINVRRGAVANFRMDTEVVLPSKKVLPLKDHKFETNILVVDIRGGEQLSNTNLTSAGELLVFDSTGGLKVLDEIAQQAAFDRYHLEEEVDTNKSPVENDDRRSNRRRRAGERGDDLLGRP